MKKNQEHKIIHEAMELMESDKSAAFISEFHQSLISAVDKTKGLFSAVVESSVSLEEAEQKQLARTLTSILGKKININYIVKPNLLAGFRITVGDWKLDASLITELEMLKKNLLNKD